MNQTILNFYLEALKLKSVIRTGWKEVGIPSEKIESVADHVYGCIILTIAIMSEKDYSDLDMLRVFKMLILKELVKTVTTERSVLSKDEIKKNNRDIVAELTNGLSVQEELLNIYDEAVALESKEAKFALHVSKIESDIQAKKYELDGDFTLDNALADIEYYPEDIKAEVLPQVKNASDGWLLFDRRYYKEDKEFESLSVDIQNLEN